MDITESQLQEFCEWYISHFNKRTTFAAAMAISMAGRFHTTVKEANKLVKRCASLHYITITRQHLTVNT